MSASLTTQIRDYYSYVDEQQGSIDITALPQRQATEKPVRAVQLSPPLRPPIRPRVGVVAAAVVVIGLLVGGVAWLLRNVPDDSVIDQTSTTVPAPVSSTDGVLGPGAWSVVGTFADSGVTPEVMASTADVVRSWAGVLEVAEAPDASAWHRLTRLSSDCEAGELAPPCGSGLVILTVDSSMVQTAIRLESEFGMTALTPLDMPTAFFDGYVEAAMELTSPVPLEFEPSSLGVEQPLRGPFFDYEPEDSVCSGPCDVGVEVEVDGLVVGMGMVVRGTGPDILDALLMDRFGRGGVLAELRQVIERRRVYQFSALPLEAAVVTFKQANGTTVWQRPLAGMALIVDIRGSGSGDDHGWIDDDTRLAGPFLVLDATGTEIMRIQDTPDGPFVGDLRPQRDTTAVADQPLGDADVEVIGATGTGSPTRSGLTASHFVEAGDALWFQTFGRGDHWSLVRFDDGSGEVERIPLDELVAEMVATEDGLWLDVIHSTGSVVHLDLKSRTITNTVEIPGSLGHSGDLIIADGGLWVISWGGAVTRIDLTSFTMETYPPAAGEWGEWVGEIDGGLWAHVGNSLTRIDLATREAAHHNVSIDATPEMSRVLTDDAIWIMVPDDVARFDLESKEWRILPHLHAGSGVGVYSNGAVWSAQGRRNTVTRIDTSTLELTDVIAVEPDAVNLVVAEDGAVWMAHFDQGLVSRIDTASRQVTHVIDVDSDPWELLASDGAIWVLTEDGTIIRIENP